MNPEKAARQRILIVDDTMANVQALSGILQEEYELLFAANGAECLQTANDLAPDLILLNTLLPDQDSHDLCAQLKKNARTQDIPVIMVDSVLEEDERAGLEAGASDYISKPFRPVRIRMRVKTSLELKHVRAQLRELAALDSLTGLASRHHFDEFLANEWRRCARKELPLSLVLADLDYFRAYNDYFGPMEGDATLRQVARLLAEEVIRPGDLIARYNSETIACLLPETSLEGAWLVAEKLRIKINDAEIFNGGSPAPHHRLTLSCGVAAMWPSQQQRPENLVAEAEEALKEAKARGRNQTGIHPVTAG